MAAHGPRCRVRFTRVSSDMHRAWRQALCHRSLPAQTNGGKAKHSVQLVGLWRDLPELSTALLRRRTGPHCC